jgi:hypothetical protein
MGTVYVVCLRVCLMVCLTALAGACASHGVRCDGSLQPINLPAPVVKKPAAKEPPARELAATMSGRSSP